MDYRTNTGLAEPFATVSKKHIFVYAVLCGIFAFAGWHIYFGTAELASLSRMPRNTSAPYDGDKRIAEALKIAKRTGKCVLVQSSAQGCGWCHVCHNLLTTNPEIEAKIEKDFVYVLVDTTNDQNRDFYKKYANSTDHTLVLVVLGADGKELARSIGFDIVQPDPVHPGNYQITPEHIMSFLNAQSPGAIKQGA
jgi:Thioredoxin-like